MNILALLQEVLGPYIQQKDEYLFNCAFCHHQKKKLSINILTYKWKCWVCHARGSHLIWLLRKLNLSTDQMHRAKELLGDVEVKKYKSTDEVEVTLRLPPEYIPMWVTSNKLSYNYALSYLKKRQIRTDDIFRHRIGYCETGKYAGRIIIPSYDKDNQLNYFVARSFYDTNMKYKNPPVSKNVIVFENQISWQSPVILVEGIFDAIALRHNAIPLLGKNIPRKLEKALVENNVSNVIIFLDNDARMDALNIHRRLSQYGIDVKVVLPREKDASELGFEHSWDYIKSAAVVDFKEFIGEKLHKIGI
jgi:5S rRNA maturation endonuclease (ribonuclease M5)